MGSERVVILGASPKPERFAHRAMRQLLQHGHEVLLVNPAFTEIEGRPCHRSVRDVPQPVDTVTMYVGAARSSPLIDDLIALKPRRIIMNPGAGNDDLEERAEAAGIEVLHDCTLVMLSSATF